MDSRQLETLYDEFAPAVYAFALQLTHKEEEAKDLLQNLFQRLASRSRITILNPRSFLLRCTYHAYVDLVRRESSRKLTLERLAQEPILVFQPDSNDAEKDVINVLLQKLNALPEEQRVVVHLKIWEERSFRQIASILDISANTAASRYRYALDKMKVTARLEDNHEN